MSDRGQESSEQPGVGGQASTERPFMPGKEEPKTAPEGYHWVEVRRLDPTKPPGYISGHELQEIKPTPQGEFVLSPEHEHLRGQLIEQADFLDKVGVEQPSGTHGPTVEPSEGGQMPEEPIPTQTPTQPPYIRGSYTADIDLEAQEKEDELGEEAVRQAMSTTRKPPQEEPPSGA